MLKVSIRVECPKRGANIKISYCVECEFFDSMNPVEAVASML